MCQLCGLSPAAIWCATVDPEFVGAYPLGLCIDCHKLLHTSPLMARLYPFHPLPLVHSN